MPTKLLRVGDVAELLNLKPKTIWNKIYGRQIDVIRIGRSVRISQEAVQTLIDRGFMPAKEANVEAKVAELEATIGRL